MERRHYRTRQGISLPLMLTILVLLAGLGVSMLTLVGSQRQLSRGDADRRACLLLRGSLESLLREQIRSATTQANHIWVSQPGLLSTFVLQGQLAGIYKLYSSAQMQMSGAKEKMADWEARDSPSNWAAHPAVYTNLNAKRDGHYPILDPAAQGAVEGFSFDAKRGVAMPVTWLYLLQDGEIVAPQPVDGRQRQAKIPGATKQNPIVGRMAFWTDDESCRLNLNTAAGGTFWEMPVTTSPSDRSMGTHAPVKTEFQRHPGHPARVELASVFPELLKSQPPYRDPILSLAPGYNPGGSSEGKFSTYLTRRYPPIQSTRNTIWHREADWTLELAQSFATIAPPSLVTQRAFFLTTDSRSSNLNLFGRPRVSLWPLQADPSRRRAEEHEFEVLSRLPTTSPASFSFHRKHAWAENEATDLSQNVLVLDYLRQMTELDPPGFPGGSLSGKFGLRDRDYVLAGIYDHVRTIQSAGRQDPATSWPPSFTESTGAGVGQVLPTSWTVNSEDVRGLGRVPTVTEAALHFYGAEIDATTGDTVKMTAVLLLELQFPGQGYPALQPDMAITLETDPTKTPTVNGTALSLTGSSTTPPTAVNHLPVDRENPSWPSGEKLESGVLSWVATLHGKQQANSDKRKVYPFIFEGLDVSAGPQFIFEGGEFHLTLSVPLADETLQSYQELTIAFPSPSSSTNLSKQWVVPTMDAGLDQDGDSQVSFQERYSGTIDRDDPDFFASDLVRSVESQRDLRILLRQRVVDAAQFAPGQLDYHEVSTPRHVSSLLRSADAYYAPALPGGFVKNVAYAPGVVPNLPANFGQAPGDWENGMGIFPDGPWSRKSDEGFRAGRRDVPYLDPTQGLVISTSLGFAARQVASPVVLGALNRGADRDWETLVFCPHPAAGSSHPGLAQPPDYLWLDLFTIPVSRPFPFSDVASAQGRVNLNQRLVPFSHITRTTALRAALRSVSITAIPPEASADYKSRTTTKEFRYEVDLDATISRWQARWDRGDVFRSETEVCGEYLIPQAEGGVNPASWWAGFTLTGDNARESPYNHLLPLLTTRSHVYRTYYEVEKLQQPTNVPADVWTEGVGKVKARLRGSLRLFRYLDPNDSRLAGLDLGKASLEPFFRLGIEELEED